ncbi:unnamed protein product [Closterium sp. Yama58-4]|nr:unnamed protein product [Closterium sp. Yama58-4]
MESFLGTLGLLTTCLLQAAYWNAFQEASSPYSRSTISTAPFSCSLLSSLLWTTYALPIVTPRRVLFLLAHLLQSLSLSALLLALISADSSSYTLRLRQVLQLLLPASGLSTLVLFLGSFFAPSSLVIGWTASAAAALLLASQPVSRMLSLLDTASSAQPSHVFLGCSALAAGCTWAAFGFAARDHFIAVPYVVVAALEALYLTLSSFLGAASSAASQQRAAEGYELVAPTASESGLTEQSLDDALDEFDEWLQMDVLHGRRLA